MFKKYGMWAILVAAVTPIPYKVFTILGGALNLPLKTFIWASIVGRGIRFLSLGVLIFIFGEEIQIFVEDQFKNLSILRKISNLEKNGILKKDKFKRYVSDDLSNPIVKNKLLPAIEHSVKLIAIFFSQCLETYSTKH